MKNFLVLFKKELARVFSDKKLVVSAFILPGVLIFAIYTFIGVVIEGFSDNLSTSESIIYVNELPDSVESYFQNSQFIEYHEDTDQYLIGQKLITFLYAEDVEQIKLGIEEGNVDLYVEFDLEFDSKIAAVEPTYINTYYNSAKNNSSVTHSVFMSMMSLYQDDVILDRVGAEQLITFGYNTNDITAVTISPVLTGLLPMLILTFLLSGAMSVGLDMVAGEKEKGTLTIYLLTPVSRFTIALSKVCSLAVMTLIAAASSLLGIYASKGTFADLYGVSESGSGMGFGIGDFFGIAVVVLSLAILVTCVITLISLMSKNVKQATTALTPVMSISIIASFLLVLIDTMPESPLLYLVPLFNSALVIKGILMTEATTAMIFAATISALIYSGLIILSIKLLMGKEKVIFGD